MTDQQHPIPPPHDQVYKWWEEACKRPSSFYEKLDHVAEQAAQWGTDQELEACCEWVEGYVEAWGGCGDALRAARRPKLKSRKQRALDALTQMEVGYRCLTAELATEIRNALEELPDD